MSRKTIRSIDELERELRLPPNLQGIPEIIITDPLEQALFDVGEKHGVFDRYENEMFDNDEY